MTSMFIWMLGIALGIAILVVSAAAGQPLTHMAASALISLVIAIIAIRENRTLHATGASNATVASSTARHMGFVWVWGALSLLVTYFFILKWHEWLHFFLAFAVAGALCLFIASTLDRDSRAGREDETMMTVARYLTINISSPNTPGLRQLQDEGALNALLSAMVISRGIITSALQPLPPTIDTGSFLAHAKSTKIVGS